MKRFHINEAPDTKLVPVERKRAGMAAAQINELFNVGTKSGIQAGKAGDYLLVSEEGMQKVAQADFDENYTFIKPEAEYLRNKGKDLKIKGFSNMGATKLLDKIIEVTEKLAKVPVKKVSKKRR